MPTRKIIDGNVISDDDPMAVQLDAVSLAALENITVGTVELGATSLAALEHISVDAVSGTVGLDAATLAALETINAIVSIADGSDINAGSTTDAAATAGGTGTISAKLRRLTAQLAAQLPAALGQGTMAQGLNVAIASDQDFVHAEDEAHVSGHRGIPDWGVQNEAGTTFAAAGDYIPKSLSRTGCQFIALFGSTASDGMPRVTGWTDAGGNANSLAGVSPFAWNGATYDRSRVANALAQVALSAATAEATIFTPTSSKKFRLMGLVLTASAQTVLTFKDNTAGTTILTLELAANVPFELSVGLISKLSAAANNVLTVTRATSAILNGTIFGQEE